MMEREDLYLHLKPGEVEALTRDLLRAARFLTDSRQPAALTVRTALLGWTVRLDEALCAREEWDRELAGGQPVGSPKLEYCAVCGLPASFRWHIDGKAYCGPCGFAAARESEDGSLTTMDSTDGMPTVRAEEFAE